MCSGLHSRSDSNGKRACFIRLTKSRADTKHLPAASVFAHFCKRRRFFVIYSAGFFQCPKAYRMQVASRKTSTERAHTPVFAFAHVQGTSCQVSIPWREWARGYWIQLAPDLVNGTKCVSATSLVHKLTICLFGTTSFTIKATHFLEKCVVVAENCYHAS
jgi:hypothetical protein